jgi:hypothetical protein
MNDNLTPPLFLTDAELEYMTATSSRPRKSVGFRNGALGMLSMHSAIRASPGPPLKGRKRNQGDHKGELNQIGTELRQ